MSDSHCTTNHEPPEQPRLIQKVTPVLFFCPPVNLRALTDAELFAFGAELKARMDDHNSAAANALAAGAEGEAAL